MNVERIEVPFGNQNIIIETGKLAKQANGAVTVTCGGTVVLVTACMSKEPQAGIDFFPLTVEYQEKTYAAGRIPGGFFKREGRPSENEILSARLIDRPIRPLFPKGFFHGVQVVALVLSSDGENSPDLLGLIGASAALGISDVPFDGPIGAVRVGILEGQLVLNPTFTQRQTSSLDLTVVGSDNGVVMIEGEASEVAEDEVIKAVSFGYEKLQVLLTMQKDLIRNIGKPKAKVEFYQVDPRLIEKVRSLTSSKILEAYKIADKESREKATDDLIKGVMSDLTLFDEFKREGQDQVPLVDVKIALEEIQAEAMRRIALDEGRRIDGRSFEDIRPISCEVNIMPRTHGSALFTRGQTQSLSIATLGTRSDEQMIDALEGKTNKTFMLHYNFPSFSVGETRPMRGPGRREIGHGALAEKSLWPVMPSKEVFPYTIRVVSEILESNGSSSMATVCAATLCLMDAGVPIKDPVAGISVGLITGDKKAVLITDIMGLEDHFGDMDFKVAGSRKGVTAIQLDLKIRGISIELLAQAIAQSKRARFQILDKMHAVLPSSREKVSEYAPKIVELHIDPSKIGEVIGPGGRIIKKIIAETEAAIDIEDDGTIFISSPSQASCDKAIEFIRGITEDPEVGRIYDAVVKKVTNFGAFCEFLPGREGLVHVSELSDKFVKDVESVVKVGDKFKVKILKVDEQNRVNLSKKQAG
ncbi:MAG TPA: polyribonucleotide nucleotidyltransferase [Candidatus Omnitrophota bacterium]|nr:polyribonucleotide nucleotidyltransferase [Candidatus Omnitrophota bacterium]